MKVIAICPACGLAIPRRAMNSIVIHCPRCLARLRDRRPYDWRVNLAILGSIPILIAAFASAAATFGAPWMMGFGFIISMAVPFTVGFYLLPYVNTYALEPPLCETCGYDLRGTPKSGACPECGAEPENHTPTGARC
jgi:predicted RNA-binding Zn-ribbon protein involved in translation (DUF1610 family)